MTEKPILFSGEMVRATSGSNAERKVRIPANEVKRAYEAGYTIKEIADAFGCSVQPVKRVMKEAGIKARPAKQRPGRMSGERNPAWRGGRRVRTDGYIVVWTPNGETLEHRHVMERHLGRPLRQSEIVHHRDGNKGNNDVSNLEVMTQSEHAALHAPQAHAARYGH